MNPNLGAATAVDAYRRAARRLDAVRGVKQQDELQDEIEVVRGQVVREASGVPAASRGALEASIHLVADLVKQGWRFRARGPDVEGRPPFKEADVDERGQKRRQLIAQRDEQLRAAPVRTFVRAMERWREFRGKRVSIFSLMRDGRELAAAISERHPGWSAEAEGPEAVRPYVQVASTDDECAETGLRLTDIWRYFRMTWSLPAQSVPGRTMMVLVRDAGAPNHPVMGIGSLSSAVVQLTVRDTWIGWEPSAVVEHLAANPSARWAVWLLSVVSARLKEIYKEDLVAEGLLPGSLAGRIAPAVLAGLEAEAAHAAGVHRRSKSGVDYKAGDVELDSPEGRWRVQAELPLFRQKRCEEIASLLRIREHLTQHFGKSPSEAGLRQLLGTAEGRRTVASIVRQAKKERVGTAIADLSVCGAIPPYNELRAGKLVAMLMCSPEIVRAYKERYEGAASVIASSVAGRPVTRPAHLVCIATTSLYGVRPSQYDRLQLPAELLGGRRAESLSFRYLDRSAAMGSFHLGEKTQRAIAAYVRAQGNGSRVHYVFGEGASPRMRGLREGLEKLGLKPDLILRHGQQRLVYGVSLVRNLQEYLLGLDSEPDYIFDRRLTRDATQRIAGWWRDRWMVGALTKEGALDRMRRHTLVHPVTHGARVRLPSADPGGESMFG